MSTAKEDIDEQWSPRSNEYDPMIWEKDLDNCDKAALVEMHLSYKKAVEKYKTQYYTLKEKLGT